MRGLIVLFIVLPTILCININADSNLLGTEPEFTKLIDADKHFQSFSKIKAINPEDIFLHIYTQAEPNGVKISLTDAKNLTKVSPFNTKLKTFFYSHGWLDDFQSESCTLIKNALLEVANVNVVIVNWDKCAKSIDYLISYRCVPVVGKYIGEFIESMCQEYDYSLDDITLVGHSLGAHISGHVGKYTNGSLGTIVGLDPAGPFFFEGDTNVRLTKDDAQYVQAIHTDGAFLGVKYDVGHADFWPNGGLSQNGCVLFKKSGCSHVKAYKYYAESLINNNFFGKKCDSYKDYEDSKCDQNSKSLMGGINVNISAVGNYYLKTNAESPFGMGDI